MTRFSIQRHHVFKRFVWILTTMTVYGIITIPAYKNDRPDPVQLYRAFSVTKSRKKEEPLSSFHDKPEA